MRSWRLTVVLSLILPLALLASAAQARVPAKVAEADYSAIDAYIEGQMQRARIPGVALGIVRDNQIIYLKGYGRAQPSGEPVTPQTPFMLASLIKPMTGMAVMQLADAGRIDLDAPVQRYLPWFRLADAQPATPNPSAAITVRHLLYHTSGIPRAAGSEYALRGDDRPNALEQHVRALSQVNPAHPVGTTYEYANLGYQALGLLVEQVSGQPYAEYIQEHLLDPLEMHQTYTSVKAAQQHGLATGYRSWFGVPLPGRLPVDQGGLPSGTVASSSAEDMTHFLIAALDDGRYGDTALVSPAAAAEMQRPAGRIGESSDFYAMDWTVTQMTGMQWIIKGGDLPDFKTQLILIPEARLGVVVLINTNSTLAASLGDLRIPAVAMGVGSLLVGQQPMVFASNALLVFTGIVLLVAILQVTGIILLAVVLRRRRSQPGGDPVGRWRQIGRIGLPLSLNLAWALFTLVLVPRVLGIPLSFLLYAIPDLGYTLLVSGVLALAWGVVSTLLGVMILRERRTPASLSAGQVLGA